MRFFRFFSLLAVLGVIMISLSHDSSYGQPPVNPKTTPKTDPTPSKDKVEFKWKFEKDKSFFQEMTTKTTQIMKVQGQDVNQVQEQTFYFKWTPTKVEPKSVTLKQTIEGIKMKIDIAGNPITFDSTAQAGTGGAPSSPLSDFFKTIVGSEFTLTLNTETMKIEKVVGQEEFLKKLSSANQAMESILKNILSQEALKQMTDPTFGILPKTPIKKDETWKTNNKLDLNVIGVYDNEYSYKYLGEDEKKLDKIQVDVKITYKAPSVNQGLPFKIKSADLGTKDKQVPGTILFDRAKGRIAQYDITLKLSGKLNIEIGNSTSDVEITQEQITSIKSGDSTFVKSPIAK